MMTGHAVVSRQEWLDARMAHLAKEKALTRRRDALLQERLNLPWERVEKKYVFETASGYRVPIWTGSWHDRRLGDATRWTEHTSTS